MLSLRVAGRSPTETLAFPQPVGGGEGGGWPSRHVDAETLRGIPVRRSLRPSALKMPGTTSSLELRPRIRRDYPLNLSISVSGGKETNKDSPSNGE